VKESQRKTQAHSTAMERTLSLFIPLCLLVLNILFCTGTKTMLLENRMRLLNPNQHGSEVMASGQPELKKQLSYLLISPTLDSFKHHILPYLPSENVIKMYDYFRSFHPQLNLEKWLEGFVTNPVVDFTESFEKKILFRSPYQFLFLPILFSQKTKLAIIAPNLKSNFLPDSFCALLESSNKIILFSFKAVNSHESFLVADDPNFGTFCVCDEQFLTIIAHGKVSNYEFQGNEYIRGWYVKYIYQAKNLNGWKEFVVAVRYFVTLPFIKYLQYISPILDSVNTVWLKIDISMDNCMKNSTTKKFCFCGCIYIFICMWFFLLYIYKCFIFHTITLPFHAFVFSLELFLLKINYFSLLIHCAFRLSLFLPYSLFCPKFIDGFLNNAINCDGDGKYVEKIKYNSFNTEPKSTMWAFSFLIPRKRIFKSYIFVMLHEILLSLVLKFGFKNWIPCGEYE